jgi:NAD(P)-dependent dehydrogenase (short-subunit alcohol dehydrogenase family)
MRLERGQVAVVTGAASGIGRAMAHAFAGRGLAVVMADIERSALGAAVTEVEATGATALGRVIDVRRPEQLDELAEATLAAFGRVDVVCNNAGVVTPRVPVWEQSYADLAWTTEVNLYGVANGIRAFVPLLVATGRGHIVNTASIAGLATIPGGGNGAYSATKHAVVGLSETLRVELDLVAPAVGVTVLCPGPVPTRIHDSGRNRPTDQPAAAVDAALPKTEFGLTLEPVAANAVAGLVIGAIEQNRFYLLPASDTLPMARDRAERVLDALRVPAVR